MARRTIRTIQLAAAAGCAWAVIAASPGARADDVAIAEKLFLEGKRLMEEGSYPSACEKFKAAHDLDTTATGTLLNLALCHEQIKKNASAWAEFRQVSAESAGRREDRVAMARAHEAKLEPLLSFVVIKVAPTTRASGMRVVLDENRPIAEASWGIDLPLDPGKHTISVSAPGKVGRSIELTIGDVADRQVVDLPALADVPPPPEPTVTEGSGQRTLGYVLGSAGVAALAAGAIFSGLAVSRNADANDAADACPNGRCPSDAARARAVDAIDGATTYANVANVTIGGGLALVVTSVILLVTSKPAAAGRDSTSIVRVGGRGATFSFGSSW